MASPVPAYRQALPSPPPAYLRSSPQSPSTHESTPRTIPNRPQNLNLNRKPVPPPASQSETSPIIQNSPRSPVKFSHGADIPEPSTARIEGAYNGPPTPQFELSEFTELSLDGPVQPPQHSWNPAFPPRRDSIQAPNYKRAHSYGHTPTNSGSWSAAEPQRAGSIDNPSKSGASLEQSHDSSSRGSWESAAQASDGYEPLAYHHQQQPTAKPVGKPAPHARDSPSGSTDKLAIRRSRLSRPVSAYSSVSDLGGQGHRRNLSASPYMHTRSSSRNSSGTPENGRSLSLLDLLNTSYPQPGPTATQFDNSRLQAVVGNNASLLSHKETFEMYLANVKKTDEPTVLYEFAVFMLNSMREMPAVDIDDPSPITRARLLRESKAILQRLADRSYPFAQYYLGDGYASGIFNKGVEDHDRAFPLFLAASKHGHVEACYRTALCYEFGWGCRADGGKAVQFYRQAASKNHPGAMMRMAHACIAGDMGLGKRYREGIKWMKRATESADAQYNSGPYELGLLHEKGFGEDVFPDETYAVQLFTKSAELGHVEACYRLGDAYEYGKLNCPRDPALSIHFYTSAAQHGHPLAMMALCAWYLVGAEPVLEKDENEAYEWALRAANLGLAKAQYAVGYFTEMGIGCRRDPLESNVWYVKAADQGDERAKHRIATIRAAAEGSHPATSARNGAKNAGRLKKSERKEQSQSPRPAQGE
ncbi:Tetratricopeptide-like helical [Penicillium bovifimosum]|uniref:Tetratricopeptide-like helical n=1 Tax=Penicillium bovifimosum TaxID=126998 RepID=A0A9W9KWL3_9EURO|nr:Tetratricopeptide-like helical [Penicillium bovifimosum]KAJ5124854.1 Tetratricopeptide-like helical [Penicillium bovifimosum]